MAFKALYNDITTELTMKQTPIIIISSGLAACMAEQNQVHLLKISLSLMTMPLTLSRGCMVGP